MSETMSETEQVLRAELADAVGVLRTVVTQMPLPAEQAPREGAFTVTGASGTLRRAEALVDELAQLDGATHEAVLLCASAKQSLALMRSCLALLCAEVDSRLAW